jgi:hypothetical protein
LAVTGGEVLLELRRGVGDDHAGAVRGSVVLHRLALVEDVGEVALARRRGVVLCQVHLVKRLVEN